MIDFKTDLVFLRQNFFIALSPSSFFIHIFSAEQRYFSRELGKQTKAELQRYDVNNFRYF